jgi:hypothetical protein
MDEYMHMDMFMYIVESHHKSRVASMSIAHAYPHLVPEHRRVGGRKEERRERREAREDVPRRRGVRAAVRARAELAASL